MKKSENLRRAAEDLEANPRHYNSGRERGCCAAIDDTATDGYSQAPRLFYELFDNGRVYYWPLTPKYRLARLIALDLAALVAEDEGD